MISKKQLKKVASLGQKKQRELQQLFVVEGTKSVLEVAKILNPKNVYATKSWVEQHEETSLKFDLVSDAEFEKMSQLKNPQGVLAVFALPMIMDISAVPSEGLVLALDEIQDPGNMGTIIRLADWFGVESIVCSPGCVDVYNPKVVQASMGSIARVRLCYGSLESFLKSTTLTIYGAFLNGDNLYSTHLESNAVVVMGNEGKGISPAVEACIQNKLHIPSFSKNGEGAESLNVSTATAIVCSEFKRR